MCDRLDMLAPRPNLNGTIQIRQRDRLDTRRIAWPRSSPVLSTHVRRCVVAALIDGVRRRERRRNVSNSTLRQRKNGA
jgi:hypothetical protein